MQELSVGETSDFEFAPQQPGLYKLRFCSPRVGSEVTQSIVVAPPEAAISVFSSGNIYGLVPLGSGGATEEFPLNPIGDLYKTQVYQLAEALGGVHVEKGAMIADGFRDFIERHQPEWLPRGVPGAVGSLIPQAATASTGRRRRNSGRRSTVTCR